MNVRVKQLLRANWYVLAIMAAVGIFMTIATTVIWPVQEPIITSRIGVATYTTSDGQTYYCFQLAENQYNDTVFASEMWGDREVVLVPAPSNYETIAINKGEGISVHPEIIVVPSGFNQTTVRVGE